MKNHLIKSYSKINLFLTVGKKERKKKLHNIQSLIHMLSLFDEIRIKKFNGYNDKINFSGKFSGLVNKRNNSVLSSLSLLRKYGYIGNKNFYSINIKKNIPVFSGLGGGSSNSATIIKFFLKKKKLKKSELNFFLNKLGSDIILFLNSNQVYQKNLSNISNIRHKKLFHFIIVYPFLKCSTKQIYSAFKSYEILKNHKYEFLSNEKAINFLKKKRNSLERVVISKFPKIKKILCELRKINNCQISRISGSGSACFGLFLSKKSAQMGLSKIKKKFPKYWCVVAKTI